MARPRLTIRSRPVYEIQLSVVVLASLILLSTAALIARILSLTSFPQLLLAVGTPYTALSTGVVLLIAFYSKRVLPAFFASLLLFANLGLQLQWYLFDSPNTAIDHSKSLRILSSNLRKGQADAESVVEIARAKADVVTVSELTLSEVFRLTKAGIGTQFPYSLLHPRPGAGGFGLWSRFPVTEELLEEYGGFSLAAARMTIRGVRFKPLVASVHIKSPLIGDKDSFSAWKKAVTAARVETQHLAHTAGPAAVIVAGDFNSTPDMRQFRDLLTNGYRDAVEQTGAGWGPTFPSNQSFPPLITIDHVLTRNAAAESIHTVTIPGSDHRALLATIQIPLDPTAS